MKIATISLCMIVKDEELVLKRCLDSVIQAVDELILVDTGSTDTTKEIAGNYTNHIYDFVWKDDFSTARNFAFSKASMDYCMWLDADDILTEENCRQLIDYKAILAEQMPDMVMMKYITGFHTDGSPSFTYYRERLIRNHAGFSWKGRIHESIPLSEHLIYSSIEIEHHKEKSPDSSRNLRIYNEMLKNGEEFDTRSLFYYGRELFYHQNYEKAISMFQQFLDQPDAWVENQLDACLHLAFCFEQLLAPPKALYALFQSFLYAVPRAEIACEIGRLLYEQQRYSQAIYWFQQALLAPHNLKTGGFFISDCHEFFPYLNLCLSYDKLGDYKKAYLYYEKAHKLSPKRTNMLLESNTLNFLQKDIS